MGLDPFRPILPTHSLQYVGAADKTLPFDECPPCVLRALELVRARAAMMSGEPPAFNELLTAAYMEKQSMGFHTDGERGLGPIVASLSMGSPAIMKFRTLEDRKTIVLSLVLRHVCLFIFNYAGQSLTWAYIGRVSYDHPRMLYNFLTVMPVSSSWREP